MNREYADIFAKGSDWGQIFDVVNEGSPLVGGGYETDPPEHVGGDNISRIIRSQPGGTDDLFLMLGRLENGKYFLTRAWRHEEMGWAGQTYLHPDVQALVHGALNDHERERLALNVAPTLPAAPADAVADTEPAQKLRTE